MSLLSLLPSRQVLRRDKLKKKRHLKSSLSFALDDEEEDAGGEDLESRKKVAKNPDVDTSHLPDRGG